MKEVHITIYRHAQGEHNATLNYHIFDPSLTAVGHQQAKAKYLERLGKKTPDLVLSSVSKRALQTAIGIYPDCKIYATQLLVEYNTGIGCNNVMDSHSLRTTFPSVNFDMFYSPIPLDIERSYEDGNRRARLVKNLIYGLAGTGAYNNIVMVSHSNFMYNLMTVFDQPALREEVGNSECIEFTIKV